MDITLVIPAAGRGSRLLDQATQIPKGMVPVGGAPLLQYVLDAGLELPISRIAIVINHKGDLIKQYFGYSYRQTPIHYVVQPEPLGIAHAVSMAEFLVKEWFVVINGDELFTNCRHAGIKKFIEQKGADGVVGYLHTSEPQRIQIGYGMTLTKDRRVERLIEKPPAPWNDILGVGTWMHRLDFFEYFRRTPNHPVRNERDFVSVIQLMIDDGQRMFGFDLRGEFFNINRREDLEKAEAALRRQVAIFDMAG